MGAAVPEPAARRTDLWVVGNVLVDLLMKGVAEIPRWGEEVLSIDRSEQIGGQGANLARAAAQLGMATSLATVVGDDDDGRWIRATLAEEGIDGAACTVAPGQTALAVAAVRPDGERAFITDLGCSAKFAIADLAEHRSAITGSRALALVGTSNLPGVELAATASLFREAQRNGVMTVFDPGWGSDISSATNLDEVLAGTDVFLPNRDEAEALTGQHDLRAMLAALRQRCPGTVIVTCGAQGSAILDGDEPIVVDALPVDVDNAVGAGDVFAAGVISGLLDEGDATRAMVRGTAAAASYISRPKRRYAGIGGWRELAAEVTISRP